jgi:hypothetical protein
MMKPDVSLECPPKICTDSTATVEGCLDGMNPFCLQDSAVDACPRVKSFARQGLELAIKGYHPSAGINRRVLMTVHFI